jgi:hypothetical protein
MHIKLTNGTPTPYSIWQLRRDNTQVSFPKNPPDALLAEYEVYPVAPAEPPSRSETEVVEDAGYLQLADGSWKQAWRVRPMNEQEVEQFTSDIRAERDQLLAASDWTQVNDAPVDKAAWAEYRQKLREIPQQEGFPYDTQWPQEP